MKKLQIILLLWSSILFSQQKFSGIVEYTLKPNEIFESTRVTKKKKLPSFLTTPANFILKFTNKESLYQKKDKKMKTDTEQNKLKISFLEIVGGGTGVFYTNNINREVLLKKETFGEVFLVSHKMTEWLFTQQTKKIGKYTCYKAIRKNKDYEKRDSIFSSKKSIKTSVWYTLEIPVPYGPSLYNGLPGLVLEANFGKIVFKATKIIVNPKNKTRINKPVEGIKIDEKEYYKKIKEIGKENGF